MNNKQHYCSNTLSQRKRILAWLSIKPLSTITARRELDVLHPAARILELRERGHNIHTHWSTEETAKGTHKVANYVLITEFSNE